MNERITFNIYTGFFLSIVLYIMKGGALSVGEIKQFLNESYSKNPQNVGEYIVDADLSNDITRVHYHPTKKHAVVSHRGSADANDWKENAEYALGSTSGSHFKIAEETQKKAEAKYGAKNISVLGHSKGAIHATRYGKNAKEIITLNKPVGMQDLISSVPKNQYDIKTTNDPVSKLRGLQRGKKAVIIKSGIISNPITEHGINVLDRLPQNQMIGGNIPSLIDTVINQATFPQLQELKIRVERGDIGDAPHILEKINNRIQLIMSSPRPKNRKMFASGLTKMEGGLSMRQIVDTLRSIVGLPRYQPVMPEAQPVTVIPEARPVTDLPEARPARSRADLVQELNQLRQQRSQAGTIQEQDALFFQFLDVARDLDATRADVVEPVELPVGRYTSASGRPEFSKTGERVIYCGGALTDAYTTGQKLKCFYKVGELKSKMREWLTTAGRDKKAITAFLKGKKKQEVINDLLKITDIRSKDLEYILDKQLYKDPKNQRIAKSGFFLKVRDGTA